MMETINFATAGVRFSLILGGARSGKTALAERMARRQAAPLTYIATAQAFDAEMAERIARHRADRGDGWTTIEAPLDLPEALSAASGAVVIDCLTLWLSNLMLADQDIDAASAALAASVAAHTGPVIAVSNEVGLGIVPDNALARRFRDAQGRLNQQMAAMAELVVFCAAGLPLVLKGPGR